MLLYIDHRKVLSTYLEKSGYPERNKLNRRRSTKLTIGLPPGSDARPLVYHSNHQALKHNSVERVNWRQLIVVTVTRVVVQKFIYLAPSFHLCD